MTDEEKLRCANATVAVNAITQSLAEILPSMLDIRATLKVSLFLVERFMDNPNSKIGEYKDQMHNLLMKELGIVN